MEREFKFRAWDKQDKRMITDKQEFIPLIVTSHGILRLNPHHKESFYEIIPIERFDIMQFTGFNDIFGIDIYEGDKIDIGHFKQKYFVKFIDGSFKLLNTELKDDNGNPLLWGLLSRAYEIEYTENSIKVIGNIHE